MQNKSFNEFYYSVDKKIHFLEEVQEEYEKNSGNITKFRGDMFCPECRVAKLGFTHKTLKKREFLSKLPSSSHKENCSYINDYATKKELKEFVNSLSNQQIQDRLEAVLNNLLNKQQEESNKIDNTQETNPFVINKVNKITNSTVRKSIPRKSIRSWFDKDTENQLFVFYGTVKLDVEEIKQKKNNKSFYRLLIKTQKGNDWFVKTKVFRANIKDEIDPNSFYDIALFGYIEFYRGFPQLKTENLSSILFRKRQGK